MSILKTVSFITIVLAALTACQTSRSTLNEQDFTVRYKDSLEKKVPDATFEIEGPLAIRVKADQLDINVYLDNAYRAYQIEPDSITSIIMDYVNASAASIVREGRAIDKSMIVPVIKPYKYLDDLKTVNHGEETLDELIYFEKYNDDLIILYAEDTEYNVSYLNKAEIDTLNIDTDTLRRFAIDNLRKLLPEVEVTGGNGNFSLSAGGVYETSLILSETMWNKTNFPVDGEIIIVIPTRNMVFVTGSNNAEHIRRLKTMAREDYENENYQVSPYLFRYNGNRFERMGD